MIITKETAPHLRRKATVNRMMIDVLIALAPTLIFAFVVYPLQTGVNLLVSLAVMFAASFVALGLRNMMPKDGLKHSFKERFSHSYKGKISSGDIYATAITAVIFTLIMPAGAPVYAIAIGALVGIVLGKILFGGLGSNIFNPAAVGMIFAKLCFGNQFVTNVDTWFFSTPDVLAGATPLGLINGGNFANTSSFSIPNLIFGQIPGALGEVYKITIIVGLIYLLIRRSIDWRIVVSYLGTFIVLILVAGLSLTIVDSSFDVLTFTLYSLLSGAVLFGATFMLTDPVTSPINSPSRVMYGIIAAIFTVFIRLFAALPEGVGFSILLVNMLAPFLDYYKWSSAKFTKKKILTVALLIVIPALLVFVICAYGGVYNV